VFTRNPTAIGAFVWMNGRHRERIQGYPGHGIVFLLIMEEQ
jgi:hypothetical protein